MDPLSRLIASFPDDSDGFNRWYWKVCNTPLGYYVEVWHAETDKWMSGTRYGANRGSLDICVDLAINYVRSEYERRQ
jgi:hypothetical protein